MIRTHSRAMSDVFVFRDTSISLDAMLNLYKIDWSEKGSNSYKQETRTITYWMDFVEEMTGLFIARQYNSHKISPHILHKL